MGLLNDGKTREEVNESVHSKLVADFKRSLSDDTLEKSPIVDKAQKRSSRPMNFLPKFALKTETLSQHDTMSEHGMNTEDNGNVGHQGVPPVEESKFSGLFFLVVVGIILVGVGALVWFKLWGSPGKEHHVDVVNSEVNNGMRNIETIGEQTVVEVQGNGSDTVEPTAETPDGPGQGPGESKGTAEDTLAKKTDKPVVLSVKSQRIRDLGRTLILGRKPKLQEIKRTKTIKSNTRKGNPIV